MNATSIEIHGVRAKYQPGETISGSVSWSAERAPKSVEVRLFWFAHGVAPMQIGLVEKKVIDRPGPYNSSHFEFVLPEGPWSFQGSMIDLKWAVEAVMLPSLANARATFGVEPEEWLGVLYPREPLENLQ